MAHEPKQIRFEEDGFEDWSDSPASSPTPSVNSFHRGSRPERGTTRIPAGIVSRRALIELGYPFAEDGDTIIVQLALKPDLIEELLRLSEHIRNFGQGSSENGDTWEPELQSRDRSFDWINVDAPAPESPDPRTNGDEQGEDDLESTLDEEELDDIDGPVVYSGVLTLENTKDFTDNIMNTTSGEMMAWNQRNSSLIGGAVTQLYSAHAAEFYMDRAGNEKITLVCPNDDGFGMADPSLVRMRWLHVQTKSLNMETLKTLVRDCPFITQSLKLVASTVLTEVTARCERFSETGAYIESGSMIQYIGRYNSSLGRYPDEDVSDTEPVNFTSAPFAVLADKPSGKRHHGNHYTRSLREVLYGYDDGAPHDSSGGAERVRVEAMEPCSIQVSQIWTLVLGSDLIITYSERPAVDLQRNLITIDETSSPTGTYTIRLIDEKDMCRYHVVISTTCKYVDFLRHAIQLAVKSQIRWNVTDYMLVDEAGMLITADTWLNLLAEGIIEDYVFGLRDIKAVNRTPNEEFRALSAKLLTSSSRSSLGSGRYSRRSSFRSEFRGSELNMQMVVHPGMWEYGTGPPEDFDDGAEDDEEYRDKNNSNTDNNNAKDIDNADDNVSGNGDGDDGEDAHESETSTLSFDSHLGAENSSLDGTVDLTTSPSEISSRSRQASTAGSREKSRFTEVPELFRLEDQGESAIRQNETVGNNSQAMEPRARCTNRAHVSKTRGPSTQREDRLWNNPQETRFTMPFRRMGRSTSFGTESSYSLDIHVKRRRRNSSWSSNINYAQNSPLDPEYLARWSDPRETFQGTPRFTGSRTKSRAESIAGQSLYSDQFSADFPPLNLAEMDFVPFLAWRLTWNDDRRSQPEIEKVITKLLDDLNASFETDKFRKWYKSAFECTEDEVTNRLETFLRQAQDRAQFDKPPADDNGSFNTLRPEASRDSFDPRGSFSRIGDMNLETGTSVTSELLHVSRKVVSAFLPNNSGLVSHPLCRRLWGSVDSILRGLRWSIDMSDAQKNQAWSVLTSASAFVPHEGPSGQNDTTDSHRCQECHDEREYSSPDDALDHWHEHHANKTCARRAKRGRPFDDPCFVWIYQKNRRSHVEPRVTGLGSSNTESASTFVSDLQDMFERADELHKLVTSVTSLNGSLNHSDSRPHLPSSLVEAFERIIRLFVLKSKEFSWMNRFALRTDLTHGAHAEKRLEHLKRAAETTAEQIRGLLNRARDDIMLLGTSKGDMNRIIIAPIGPEFLVASLISNLQNNMFLRGSDKTLDLVSHYRNHTARLRFNTNRRPKREAFVKIHALEEELEALQMVAASQQGLWRAYQKLFSPLTFRCPTTDWFYYKERKSMFKLESKCVRRQQRRLVERNRALWVLRKRTRALRDETKQRIEILDEGHGKAIRVFTIVTLFFLPLSFVTSFFGMNTTDIRDTEHSQKIFWSTALPVTFGVIGLAFMYGYKWDLMRSWLSRTFKSTKQDAAAYLPPRGETLSWTAMMDQEDSGLPRHEPPRGSGWRERVSFLSEQRQRRKKKTTRHKTDDSLFHP